MKCLQKLAQKTAPIKHGLVFTLSLVLAGAVAAPALAEYPDRPVSFVVPFPPGDLEDVLTRIIADEFQDEYGVPAAVVNKPGGGGGPFPGAMSVATAPADGYTIGSFVITVPVVGENIGLPELNPMPFEPLGIFVNYPFLIATSNDAPYQTMEELAAYAGENDVVLGVFGAGFPPARVTQALASKLGFDYGEVAVFDSLDCNTLASGDADVINTSIQLVLPCLDKIKVLATVTSNRIAMIPDVPTAGEFDPLLGMAMWNGLFVHKDTPQDIRDKIIASAKKAVMGERAQKVATDTGAEVFWMDADQAKERIELDKKVFAEISKVLD